MIAATIEADRASIRVVSGALDVTYEVRPADLFRRSSSYSSASYVRTGKTGYVFDLVGAVRKPTVQAPYIWGCVDFETAVRRALSKAHRLERVWRKTTPRSGVSA